MDSSMRKTSLCISTNKLPNPLKMGYVLSLILNGDIDL